MKGEVIKLRDKFARPYIHKWRDFGVVVGAIVGAYLVYRFLPHLQVSGNNWVVISHIVTAFMSACGAYLGASFGYSIGGLIDIWLAPKVEQLVQDAAENAGNRQHRSRRLH
jgi:hypothetical protein